MPEEHLLIISPVRDEAAHIERTARALAGQTRRPARWLVVDDGSTDETPAILARLAAELDFMSVVATPPGLSAQTADRLAIAAEARAFNYGLHTIDPVELSLFTHIGKLDGDIELRPDYYELVLAEFGRNPRLGMAGGTILEHHDGAWRAAPSAEAHVRGALKLYTRECYSSIGGMGEQLAWDAVDEVLARMRGFQTRSFATAEALHHRHAGSADGRLRGHARWGEGHWITQHGLLWTMLWAAKVAAARPRGISGLAYLYGYGRAAARRVPRMNVEGYRRFVRAEHQRRIAAFLRGAALPGRPATRSGG
jgi:glycosyltransferase involved in cell wall biosynthesis